MEGTTPLSRTPLLVSLSCKDTPRTRRRHRRWTTFSLRSCTAYDVQDSLPYKRVLRTQAVYILTLVFAVGCLFSHTLLSLEMVVTALPVRLSRLTSRDRLFVAVEPS